MVEKFRGSGRILSNQDELLAVVDYVYQIDRTNRVWGGVAVRSDGEDRLPITAGPAVFETADGQRASISYYHRKPGDQVEIVFTGRGTPPEA